MADKTVRIIVKGVDEVSGVFDNIGKKIGGRGGLAGALGKVGLVAGGAVVAGVGAAAVATTAFAANGIQKATSLEQQMANIAAVMGKTSAEVAPLNDLILDLGMAPDLKVDTFEAAEAIELLARNGLSMDQIMQGAAKSAIQLSNATGGTMAGAADVATDLLAMFNIEAADMGRVVDGVTSVVNNSKFSFDDYRLALAQSGGVAAAVGVSLEDLNTTIAATASNFASGSDAGTSFKTFLQRLVPQSNKAIDMMRDLGIITEDGMNLFFDAQGNMKSMADIAGILAEATAGLSEEQINQAFSTIFGTDAMRTAFGLAKTGKEDFLKLQQQMGQTSAADAVATRMDTLSGQMEILRGTIEAVAIKVGQRFMPALKGIVSTIQEFVSTHADSFIEFFGKLADFVALALPKILEFAGVLADIGRFVMAVVESGDPLNDWLTHLPPAIQPVMQKFGEMIVFFKDEVIPILQRLWQEGQILGQQFAQQLGNELAPSIDSIKQSLAGLNLSLDGTNVSFGNMSDTLELLSGFFLPITGSLDMVAKTLDIVTSGLGRLNPSLDGMSISLIDILKWLQKLLNLLNPITFAIQETRFVMDNWGKTIDAIKDKLGKLEIPDWLKPGSPPPLAFAIADINKQLKMLDTGALNFNGNAGMAGMAPAGAMGGGGGGNVTNIFNIDGVRVSTTTSSGGNAEDQALIMLIEKIRRALQLQ